MQAPEDSPLPWRIWIDTGGTFTDGIALDPAGRERRVKILSSSSLRGTIARRLDETRLAVDQSWGAPPGGIDGMAFRVLGDEADGARVVGLDTARGVLELDRSPGPYAAAGTAFELLADEEAPVLAARLLTGTPAGAELPPTRMRLATTLGTNALLERRGVPTALFITRGLGDLLEIGTQQRPDLFALNVVRPAPLYAAVVEVPERLDAAGGVLEALDPDALTHRVADLLERGIRAAAVALLHSYRNPSHEQQLEAWLRDRGFDHVSCSAQLAPRIKLLPRAQTAVVDAYLAPVVRTYLERVAARIPAGRLLVMTSAGGLVSPAHFAPKDSLLSGPAGGVVGAAAAGRAAGFRRVISFDMGGTSTDVARYDGDHEYRVRHRVGDVELVAPALAIETVAAGGGSICWLDGERLRVGPQSAGAQPGPACYGAGGPLTVTDVNLLLGRLVGERFEIPIRPRAAEERLAALERELAGRTAERASREALLEGLLTLANETMADAIRTISLRQGYDPGEYALVAFGGAGGQHACGVAGLLGVETIVVPADAALLSALGLGRALIERFAVLQVLRPLAAVESRIADDFDELARAATADLVESGVAAGATTIRRRLLHLRFAGQDAALEVDWDPGKPIHEAFVRRYVELYGHRPEDREVELESMRVVASSGEPLIERATATPTEHAATEDGRTPAVFGGIRCDVPLYDRDALRPGARLDGPALVLERFCTTVVEPGWSVAVDGSAALVLTRGATAPDSLAAAADSRQPEAIRLELFTQRFQTLVREMGERLERTAVSTNVKERLDFSCALLDPAGELVVNAPHIPVHLGALGLCVRRLRDTLELRDGDVAVTNHPSYGGSHLPDVTVVTAVHAPGGERLGYTASRAHHAEIGGIRPGSMPPFATRLAEEGVVLAPMYLVRQGRAEWEGVRRLLLGGPHPTRNVEDNLADLRAAVAANHAGAEALRGLAAQHGRGTLLHYMEQLKALAEARIGEALRRLGDGTYRAEERLDDGSRLAVALTLSGGRARIDFAGSADVHPGNLNATPAIVHSAVIYVLRLLLQEPLPLNEGLLRAVSIDLPRGMLNPVFDGDPAKAPAVVGGNVETSQRLVDTLLKALGIVACSQGTMNNLIFGNARYGYYETLGGGCGAGPDFDGAHAVHHHMTNTRITDPEILEQRYPVRVARFVVRRGSGGAGRRRGGDGLIRELLFLEPASVSLLTQHRVVAPYGMHGGAVGTLGTQRWVRPDGSATTLGSADECDVAAGDRLIVETPGGGGYGVAD